MHSSLKTLIASKSNLSQNKVQGFVFGNGLSNVKTSFVIGCGKLKDVDHNAIC